MDIKTIDDLKDALELAAMTDKALPPAASLNAKSTWPDFLRDKRELAVLRTEDPEFTPTQEDISFWEEVCLEWINFFSQDEKRKEWAVIWLKACKCPSKIIEKKTGMCRTKVWYCYDRGLRKLYEKLTHTPLIVDKPKRKSRIRAFSRDIITIREAIERLEKKMRS